jgi:hypothetical protein
VKVHPEKNPQSKKISMVSDREFDSPPLRAPAAACVTALSGAGLWAIQFIRKYQNFYFEKKV